MAAASTRSAWPPARAQAGLPVPDGALDNAALLELISAPGFSTRDASDRVSGRGFGMNVVRETLQELGGTIQLETEPGQGTRFIIELPLTLAITAAMLARVGDQIFAVPQAAVREVAEFEAAAIRALQGAEMVEFRGAPLPVLRLSTRARHRRIGRRRAFTPSSSAPAPPPSACWSIASSVTARSSCARRPIR